MQGIYVWLQDSGSNQNIIVAEKIDKRVMQKSLEIKEETLQALIEKLEEEGI